MKHFSIIPLNDNRQALRVRRGIFALLGAAIHSFICFLLWADNLFRLSGLNFVLLFGSMWVGHIIYFIIIRSGWNKRFLDPSLTVPMMLWAITCLMYTVYLANELRSVLLMFYLLALVFGAFHLAWRQFLLMTLYGMLLYLIVIISFVYNHPGLINLAKEWIIFLCFSLVSFNFSIISSEMNGLRKYLHEKNEKLGAALKYIESVSITDELTGIKNRRFILNILENQRLMAERGQYVFSICMLDIDHFKDINDTYGHVIGDNVLKTLCQEVLRTTRQIDYFARLGGEEFLLILPFADVKHAAKSAERIRKQVENIEFNLGKLNLKLTISVGVVAYHWPERPTEILTRVDAALYEAKRNGRNKVVVHY